ncbi:MAG: hypothetical protein FWH02_07195 [Oscillospiraceae bacterium]|nr:hypothetical protein [Oscillospiraceae bacterium]
MKKSSLIALVALFVAVIGVVIALAAYFNKRGVFFYDEDDFMFDDPDDAEYYTSDLADLDGDEPEDAVLDTDEDDKPLAF